MTEHNTNHTETHAAGAAQGTAGAGGRIPAHGGSPLRGVQRFALGEKRLIDTIGAEGLPFGVSFAGQGFDWLGTLAAHLQGGSGQGLKDVLAEAASILAPVADDIAAVRPHGFDPLRWAHEAIDADAVGTPGAAAQVLPFDPAQAAISVPGILVSQMAVIDALESQGLVIEEATGAIGHSQGVLAVELLEDLSDAAGVLVIAELIGAAVARQARITGLVQQGEDYPMLLVAGATRQQIERAIEQAFPEPFPLRPVIGLRNAREAFVVVGVPRDVQRVREVLEGWAAKDAEAIAAKAKGGKPFAPVFTPLDVQVGFHHPALAPAVEQVAQWAHSCGVDAERARRIAQMVIVDPVDWVRDVSQLIDAGVRWIVDLGPADGVDFLTADIAAGRGIGTLAVGTDAGQQALFEAGHAPELPVAYEAFAPRVTRDADGQLRVHTKFTILTGRSPMMLPGMTPTTVDPEIVAAAANAGHWAELAGGGQVTPEILENNLARLADLVNPGVNVQFNSMFLDPYLWKMQIGGSKLVQRARRNGAPVDGVVITAGLPELDEAVSLIHELRDNGFSWVVFKPGAVRQIEKVLEIARAVPEVPIIIQVEGGKAGGHHSWEDLDDLLIATYGAIRATENTVLCVGGGIGTPQRAADYLLGTWAEAYDLPAMPVDGILLGTVTMACKEAKTSPAVKQLLVETRGVDEWVGAGQATGGMASGRSQLGADIHEIDNSAAKAGRLLDEVAGDEAAVAARREEIIAAIARTAKPYFGDVDTMTYAQWLARYVELQGPTEAFPGWIDASWAARFEQLLARAEARLADVDHGEFSSALDAAVVDAALAKDATAAEVTAVVDALIRAYPQAEELLLHPADVAFFFQACRTPGKPVGFVPVIDKDVRRWWRSDSLWQAHDARFDADAVCVIPGTAAVAGITRADEPVAELLDRFCLTAADRVVAEYGLGGEDIAATAHDCVAEVLESPGTFWAGRNIPSLVHRLGAPDTWGREYSDESGQVVRATHAGTGATLEYDDATHAVLRVPLRGSTAYGTHTELAIRFTVPEDAAPGSVPIVTACDAVAAMSELTRVAAGGQLPETTADGTAVWETMVDEVAVAKYRSVTEGFLPASITAESPARDVLVGAAWPAIFAAVRAACVPAASPQQEHDAQAALSVVEGMLNLVHLEHHITVAGDAAADAGLGQQLRITARAEDVADTDMGRIIVVRAQLRRAGDDELVATLSERFAIRGRSGKQTARTNTSILPSVVDTPRSFRAQARVTAPADLRPFALASGDRNPIHVSDTAARLAGLPGVIVHGMWTSAMGELIAVGAYHDDAVTTRAMRIVEYTATMLAPVLPGAEVEFVVERAGVDDRPGRGEVRAVTATVDGQLVMQATAVMAAPRTFYAFPGQGIQSQGMGMESRASSAAAKAIWDRADAHTRSHLGFSIVEVVENNPQEIVVQGERFFHPQGVLFLTQFTQVAMACLGVAQIAEMREAAALNQDAYFAGHSVGEYNALAAYAGVLSLESVVEIVYRRGLTMHRLVERDEQGRSNYGLAALRPNKMGVSEDQVAAFVADIAAETGEFLEIVNYNLAGLQYAVAGTVAGLKALADAAENAAPGQRALIMIPGIDVPFHSSHLRDGVGDFREHLDRLLPRDIDIDILVGRYIPNLVARPFELSADFVSDMLDVVDPDRRGTSPVLLDVFNNFDTWAQDSNAVARVLLVELLAWQFASPVRWIETQDVALRSLGLDRFVEVGVGSAPTIANMMGQTLRLPQYVQFADALEVLNVERDRAVVFATDEVARVSANDAEDSADAASAEAPEANASAASVSAVSASAPSASAGNVAAAPTEMPAAAAPAGGERPADLVFGPGDATDMLIALWTKVRPDQMGATDSIETLVEGVSSRRNQLLLDLGVEFGLGAIDGAADAELADLKVTVAKLAKGYTAFGPVLGDASADALRRVTGPAGKRPAYVAERVTGTWGLGQGWADHVTAAVVMGTREGASLRGGELAVLAPAAPATAAELDAVIDAAVQQVAQARGISVGLPSAASGGGVVDSAALGEFAEQVTGKAGVLAATARTILAQLGLDHQPKTQGLPAEEADKKLFDLVSAELGSDWPRLVSQSFDANKAVLLDDRWASAREDIARIAHLGADADSAAGVDVTGQGEVVAQLADFAAARAAERGEHTVADRLAECAAQARDMRTLPYSEDVAVVTGASPNSIAAAVTAGLLRGGAQVIVTTSSLDHRRLEFYKSLYRSNARGAAALWVVPANLSSFSDLDAVIEWIGSEQTTTVNGEKKLIKPALKPTLLFPFAAPRVMGTLADAGPRAENEMRLLLWSVERLIAGLSTISRDSHVGARMHVVLPGSPNRGRFGGDGAYGEAKAALDALVTRWHAEPAWAQHTSVVHALIGWVRGTGLMGGNDPLVDAVEAVGVTTYATEDMAQLLLGQITAERRAEAAEAPVVVDFTGGLGDVDLDLAELGRSARAASTTPGDAAGNAAEDGAAAAAPTPRVLSALPTMVRNGHGLRAQADAPAFGTINQPLEDMVVLVGAAELGPYGSSRTRFDAELTGTISAAGVIELAWSMGLIHWDTDPTPGWYTAEGDAIDEAEIFDTYRDEVLARVGVRQYHDDFGMVDNLAPELTTIYLDHDITFQVADMDAAKSFMDSHPDTTSISMDEDTGEWLVTRRAGTPVRVPRRMAMSRFVGGQIPEGFDPAVWGIPADMVDNLDRVACWNVVCTVDAFLSSGFTPQEVLRHLHPTRVSSTQGTGMGGMESMRSLYLDGLLAEPRANDILQEALPNVVAAHVMQSYVGGYGQMIHPVAACATAAVSVEEGMDKIRLGKADFVVAGGLDDLSIEGITGFGDMAATADSQQLRDKGIADRFFSRANDRRRAGFVESAGGGTLLLARGSVAADLGLPVLGVIAFAESFADGAHTSIPAPGLGALSSAQGGANSRLARGLAALDVTADDITIISKHDTSTAANDPNESDLHERIAASLGRAAGNPLYVISQKTLTGHAKGGAAAFQIAGLAQVLATGSIPANRSLDCVDPVLAQHSHLVWLRQPLHATTSWKAGLVTSLGFGHVSALIALVHTEAFRAALAQQRGEEAAAAWQKQATQRAAAGARRLLAGMHGGAPLYSRPVDRNLGATGAAAKEREAAVLLDPDARLVDGVLRTGEEIAAQR